MTRREVVSYSATALVAMAALAVVLLAVENRYLGRLLRQYRPLAPGERAPLLEAEDVDGRKRSLGRGRAVVIFFNTSCPACVETAGQWQAYAERLSGVVVLGVSADSRAETIGFAAEHGLRFPVIADPEQRIVRAWRVSYVPQVVLVDGEGVVRFVQRYGQSTVEALGEVEALVGAMVESR
jgi:peroxiredoxin Q/BCP